MLHMDWKRLRILCVTEKTILVIQCHGGVVKDQCIKCSSLAGLTGLVEAILALF